MQHSYTTDIHTQQTLIATSIGRNKYRSQQTQYSYTTDIHTQQTLITAKMQHSYTTNIHTQQH